MSLFKSGLTRKPHKATLHNTLLTKKVDTELNSLNVFDGGELLHKVRIASFVLITSHQNMASAQLYLTDTVTHHLPKIMSTQQEVSIRGAV